MIWQDLRFAIRTQRRSPVFAAVAVVSLALGIGANTAIFSLINALMLRTLPVREPGQLVELLHKLRGEPDPRGNGFSLQAWQYMRDHNHVFSNLLAASDARLHVRTEGRGPEVLEGEYVDGMFFRSLGVRAAAGRLIGPDDRTVGVVSWARFHSDPSVLGRQIVVEDVPVTVIGAIPRDFHGWLPGATHDLWLPLAMKSDVHMVQVVGRLKPGVTLAQALAEMSVLDRRVLDEAAKTNDNPYLQKVMLQMEPAGAGLATLRDKYARPLLMLMSIVGLLLLIACTNVASMLLARAAAREREMAVRIAIGASRLRLVQMVLTESVLLSLAGTVPGIALAYLGTSALVRIIASGRDHIELHVQPDMHILLFTTAVALLAALLFGLAPAVAYLRRAGRIAESRFGRLFGKTLVISQVAFSVMLLGAASLFVSHLSKLEHLDLGFRRDQILLATLDAARSGYGSEQLSRAYQDLLRQLEAIPGVRTATLSAATPISGAGAARSANVEGYQATPGEVRYIQENWIAPKYFETFGTPLLAGRDFALQDEGRHLAIIDQSLAHYYSLRSPIGMHVTFDGDATPYEIIGVAADANYRDVLEKHWRTIYFNAFERGRPGSRLALRTSVDPESIIPALRRIVRERLKTVPITKVTTMADQIDASIVTERLIALLAGLFGALGALLAAIGLYGLLAYTVARRTREIGIRMALGARQWSVVRMVLQGALVLICAGLLAGIPLALSGRRLAESAVEGLPSGSLAPVIFAASSMIAVSSLAAWIPARRAAQVDPMEALRHE
ncbi:MAG: putative transport system permease protein [Bryobacterales bacterium]|nr:putative transport system permease protein [Bryobacterales bacterium]